jgi:hypothetical protein
VDRECLIVYWTPTNDYPRRSNAIVECKVLGPATGIHTAKPVFPHRHELSCNGSIIVVKKSPRRTRLFHNPRISGLHISRLQNIAMENATRATKPQPNPAAFRASIAGSSPNLIRASRPVRQGIHGQLSCQGKRERDVGRLNCPGG